jgi:poly-gamma-glutamate synthesis protein (capsule biosynthesis protein)
MKRSLLLAQTSLFTVLLVSIISCSSLNQRKTPFNTGSGTEQTLELAFTGDIMAHEVNYRMGKYSNIYESVKPALNSADLCFGNLEIPVVDTLPLSTYPRFNVHTPYVSAAVDAGFTVFSLANNHANDQGSAGILSTRKLLESMQPRVHSSGLRQFENEPMRPVTLKVRGREIVFLAVTEILNSYDKSSNLVYYVPPRKKERDAFLAEISRIRRAAPSALFVLSIHLNEPEYVRTVSAEKREWFRELACAGVDIVWGHHPHVMQEWESVTVESGGISKPVLFMYSMGNFISGQRNTIDRENPGAMREYTGDGVIMRVTVGNGSILATPIVVTNYTDPREGPVVKPFDGQFVSSLNASLASYYTARYDAMRAYLPLPPMPVRAILE